MKILQGQGVSKGVEHGPIYFCRRSQTLIQPDKADDPRFQGERLDRAMEQTAQQLGQMAELARAQAGDSAAQLFETHAMFLEDEDYTGAMEELLAEGYCAEYAVDQAGEQFSAMLAAMDDPYMQARACDVKDVTGRILNNLTGVVEGGIDSQVPVILAAADLAPAARYYPCNETLRPLFYTGTLWHARDFAAAPVLLLPQGNYPLKNLHTVIKALPAVLAEYGDAELRIAGWPPLDKGPLLRPVIDRMFPYKLYCKRLAAQLGVTEHIRYTGPLDAAAMRQAYLEADVFLLPSGCENSPNSLGEAMLLGLPCVASAVGGISSMLANGTEGLLYGDALDADALARAVLQVLHSPDGGTAMGRAARARALQTHDAARNAADLLHIYESILQEEHP